MVNLTDGIQFIFEGHIVIVLYADNRPPYLEQSFAIIHAIPISVHLLRKIKRNKLNMYLSFMYILYLHK